MRNRLVAFYSSAGGLKPLGTEKKAPTFQSSGPRRCPAEM